MSGNATLEPTNHHRSTYHCSYPASVLHVSMSREGARPRDVAMAIGVKVVARFAKEPTGSGETFAQGKEVGGDVLLSSWKAFSGGGELIHKGEAEVMLFGGKIDRVEPAAEMAGGIPTNLAAQAGGMAGSLDGLEVTEELEE